MENHARRGGSVLGIGIGIGISFALTRHFLKHAIDHADMEVHMRVQAGAKPVDKRHCAEVQGRLIHLRRPRAVGLQALRDDPQKNTQHHVEHGPITLHEVAQSLGHRQHPLAHRQAREDVVRQVSRCLHHAPGIARGANTPAFAGIGHKIVVSTVVTPRPGKAVGKDAALQIFAKDLADIGSGGVVVALPVELACTGEFMPGLEVFGNRLVEKGALGVARVVELGLCTRWSARMGMCLRWACGGGHGAVPARAGCLMLLGLYPALCISLVPAGSLFTPELIAGCAHSARATGRFGSSQVARRIHAVMQDANDGNPIVRDAKVDHVPLDTNSALLKNRWP